MRHSRVEGIKKKKIKKKRREYQEKPGVLPVHKLREKMCQVATVEVKKNNNKKTNEQLKELKIEN